MPINVREHFEQTRKSLVSLYRNSTAASHSTVQGSLREGFVRSVLAGHVGDAVAWSTGQIVGKAPSNYLSGQLDLIAHRGDAPQIYIQDHFLRLIPGNSVSAVVEVKSNLTTGDMSTDKGKTSVLKQALDTLTSTRLAAASKPPDSKLLGISKQLPFFLVAYTTGIVPETLIQKVQEYLQARGYPETQFWPTAIVVLSGPKSQEQGYGVIRSDWPQVSRHGKAFASKSVRPTVSLSLFEGGDSLAALVCQLALATGSSPRLEEYVF